MQRDEPSQNAHGGVTEKKWPSGNSEPRNETSVL